MEFSARYLLTGLFTLLAIFLMFLFVYWLKNTGGFGEKAEYEVHFSVPVSGLSTGGDVLFNGIKVGEVAAIRFDDEHPERLIAIISVARQIPIRADTVAGVDYQGLTGAANILLSGGSGAAPRLVQDGASLPVIEADIGASRSWTQNAARVFARIDDMLSRNTGRFDAILAGLERMTGGGAAAAKPAAHDLAAPDAFTPPENPAEWQLAISEPTVLLSLNTDRVQQQIEQNSLIPLGEARWSDNLPNLFQAKIVQSFENAGYLGAVLRPADAVDAEYRLLLDIRDFSFISFGQPAASIDIVAKIINREGAVVAAQRFQSQNAAAATDEAAAIPAMAGVFSTTVEELVKWTVAAL